jgi:hypothetical protein
MGWRLTGLTDMAASLTDNDTFDFIPASWAGPVCVPEYI